MKDENSQRSRAHEHGHQRSQHSEHGTQPAQHARGARSRRHKRSSRPARTWEGFTPEQREERAASVPAIIYPEELPVSARREEIAQAIRENQVVIVAGETGSGKTTQLPKICLELGRGIDGLIGHTQPRRIAARSVAERIAHELGTSVSADSIVGYQVRFTEETGPHTLVKLMTDGILLAEIQSDPQLRRYDTIIVDEAHERSLNIDFILGYLARLLPQRPDLKVIITSATIDSERFAAHFGTRVSRDGLDTTIPAPIIEVSGRTYPVEVRYRPLAAEDREPASHEAPGGASHEPRAHRQAEEDRDQVTGILDAVDELMAEGPGDILVFLAGERDIRDTESALADHLGPRYVVDGRSRTPGAVEVLPLYSRLSAAEQHRIFEAHSTRRIVLATNVAETSLTVPGIRYVIDPGLARISRYSNRTKVQRLPIEPISQASANQRSGRCGRVADGIAIRLYSEADFEGRPEYTEPEILRTSLASVILQMAALGLGEVEDFPFLDAPDHRAVRDGLALLAEIGAIDPHGRRRRSPSGGRAAGPVLTEVGRRLARLPLDPRLGRMLIEAGRLGCVGEVMVIVAALSIQDVRERPADAQEASDALHRRFADPTSDFLTYLNLWRYLRTQQRELSGSAFRRMCKAEHLHYLRVREWQDVYTQLRQLARPLGLEAAPVELPTPRAIRAAREALEPGTQAATIAHGDVAAAVVALGKSADTPDADAIHRSLLVGLLSNIGHWDERRREYEGARGSHFSVWPGSGLRRKTYDWVMTAELVETSRLFARTVAKVDPRWIEEVATTAGLLKRIFGEPYWSTRQGTAMVHEKVLVYGLTLAADRPSTLASVGTDSAREVAREMFLRRALVEGEWNTRHHFVARNAALIEELQDVEHRRRERGLLASDEALFHFYDERVPDEVTGAIDFDAWWKRERHEQPELLDYTRELLLPGGEGDDPGAYPDTWVQGDLTLSLEYVFEPGSTEDGLSVIVPVEVLGRLEPAGFDWLVPGMRPELAVATIRALPKAVRRQLVPAPDTGAAIWEYIRATYPASSGVLPTASLASAPDRTFQQAFGEAASRLRGVEITAADWAVVEENLPEYLKVSFVAVDAAGHEISRGKDLVALQKRLATRTEQAVRSVVRGALAQAMMEAEQRQGQQAKKGKKKRRGTPEAGSHGASTAPSLTPAAGAGSAGRGAAASAGGSLKAGLAEKKGLTAWPTGIVGLTGPEKSTIPATVESTGTAGLVVRGYPTLVASGPMRADLTILPDATAQEQAHGAGVRALALAATALPSGRISSRWSGTEALTLAASPYASTEALTEDLQVAAAHTVAEAWATHAGKPLASLREKADFEALTRALRDGLEDEVYRLAQIVVRVLQAQRDVERAVGEHTSMALLGTLQQVREHAASLVYPGFISATPALELAHLPRFLAADAARVEKAAGSPAGPSQDAAAAFQVQQAEDLLTQARQRAQALPADAQREAVLADARWLIEEFRVSLFAQTLGTSRKVSLQRIRKLLASI